MKTTSSSAAILLSLLASSASAFTPSLGNEAPKFAARSATRIPQQERTIIAQYESSSSSTTATLERPTDFIDWNVKLAKDDQLDMVADLVERKCAFDRSLNGEPPSKIKPAHGDTLDSLCPSVKNAQFLLVSDNTESKSIGFATYGLRYYGFGPPMLWLEDVFVDPTIRSQGAGKAIMDKLYDIAKTTQTTHLAWDVDERNARGIQFYQKLGAEKVGQQGTCIQMEWQV